MADILKIDGTDSLLIDGDGSELLLETPALTLNDLLSDTGAQIELIVSGTYLDDNDTPHTEWISQTGWDDEIGGASGIGTIPPLLTTNLRINQQVNPLDPLSSFDTFGDIELSNNHLDYAGRYDLWWKYSVDGQAWNIYAVGYLSDGRRVEISNVINTPLFTLKGVNIPEVGSDTCRIRTIDAFSLTNALQPSTYSPPALLFPATIAGVVDLGDNLDITGVQSITAWIYLNDINITQYVLFKDSGTAGYYLAVGLCGGGTLPGAVEIGVRGQTPPGTGTAANVIKPLRWHRIDISIDTTSRRIDIDGITAVTTVGITGTPLGNSTSLSIGRSLDGRIHRVLWWSDARSNATMSAEGRTPITGAETNLREGFMFGEGSGTSVVSIKAGSSLVGTIGDGVLWDTASWHYDSILGQYEPYVLGTVPRAPVTWIDPPKQIGQVSKGPIALLSELQSNHAIVNPANYTANLSNSTVTVTSGALSGTYSATVTANNLWNSALYFDATLPSSATRALTMPAASKYLGVHFRSDLTSSSVKQLAGWLVGGTSAFLLRMVFNTIYAIAINDAGTIFIAQTIAAGSEGRRYSALGSLDTANPATGLKLYLNGVLVATTAISGAWTGTQTTLGIGCRASGTDYFTGVIDEVVVGNTAATLEMAESYHALPSTSAMAGILAGWHLDEGNGSSPVAFVGAGPLTLTGTTWTAGRSALTDLARSIFYSAGLDETDLDTASWWAALLDNDADCGWFVSGGAKSIDVLNVILGGLGFIAYRSNASPTTIHLKRFEGVSGTPDITLDTDSDLQNQPIESGPSDPAIYLWTIIYATNNSKQDAANIAGGLASTDPDRYQYGSMAYKSLPKSDSAVLSRFPDAETRTRTTALLNRFDAEVEGARLLAIHRHGADRKSLATFIGTGQIDILDEMGPLTEECDLDAGDAIVIGISIEDGSGTITIWRPAIG